MRSLHHALLLAALLCGAAQAEPPQDGASAAPAASAPYPSQDGTLVIDPRAGIAWARCVEGMAWNGATCVGQAQRLTHAQAQARARALWQDSGVRWRLPRVSELRRLVHRSAKPPAVDARLFPAAPADWHWSATASVNSRSVNPYAYGNVQRGGAGEQQISAPHAWAVDMASGEASGQSGRGARLLVRLVRPAP